jgi:hypothetical protein
VRSWAIAFAWAWGLSDWRAAAALGVSEGDVRRLRRALGLQKTGGGMPARSLLPDASFMAGVGTGADSTIEKAAAGETATAGYSEKRLSS